MTLTIVNHYTHEKTFTVVGESNGAVKKLREHGYNLNPRTHDESYPEPDGSSAGPSSAGQTHSPPFFTTESESEGPSGIFGRREE